MTEKERRGTSILGGRIVALELRATLRARRETCRRDGNDSGVFRLFRRRGLSLKSENALSRPSLTRERISRTSRYVDSRDWSTWHRRGVRYSITEEM